MRSKFLVLPLILFLGAAVSARTRQETVRAEFNKRVTADRGRITIRFLEVLEDSRCSVNATCIWAGNAKIKISVAKGKSVPQILELNTLTEPAKQTLYGYEFSIKELYPQKGDSAKMKVATVLTIVRK